jgi:GTP-binding protein LepA
MDYEFKEYRAADVVKVDILINGDRVDALSIIVHRRPEPVPRPRGGGQDARADPAPDVRRGHPGRHRRQHHRARDIKALRKNVLAKCYGGDITRKRKLLEKQKAGKKRMKQIGSVEVPQEAFLAILQVDD